jgi:hypothetical protein
MDKARESNSEKWLLTRICFALFVLSIPVGFGVAFGARLHDTLDKATTLAVELLLR